MQAWLKPMLCEPVDVVPEGDEWIAEGKLDGWRIISHVQTQTVGCWSRGAIDYSARLPHIVAALRDCLPPDSAVDGELIGADWNATQSQVTRSSADDSRLSYVIFDLIRLGGLDARPMPWRDRRLLLERMHLDEPLSLSPTGPSGPDTLEEMLKLGLEGIVCKRVSGRYVNGRTNLWVKCKPQTSGEAVIRGFKPGKIGGQWDGKVGAFEIELLDSAGKPNGVHTTVKCGVDANHHDAHANPHHWLGQIIEIKHHGIQKSGKPRHPMFFRRRDDMSAPPAHAPRSAGRRAVPSATNGATGKMRNYKAMKDAKLLACVQDLAREEGDAYERALVGSGNPSADLEVARGEARARGLV